MQQAPFTSLPRGRSKVVPELPEGYIGYRSIRPLEKGFLTVENKHSFSLIPLAMKALLGTYRRYYLIVVD